jgi:O-antigen ligase
MMFRQDYPYRLALAVGGGACLFGLLLGSLAGTKPLLIGVLFVAIATPIFFFRRFEQASLCLLIIRSALDTFSNQGLPAAFAIGFDALILLYVLLAPLVGRKVITDKFFWIFASWVAIQSLWLILAAIGGLGLGSAYLGQSIREWVRVFSWLMVYLIISQLKGRLHPEQVANSLFLALIIPLFVATMQLILPNHLLPGFLQAPAGTVFEAGSRINGTLGHPNTFTSFLVLFIGLTYWKAGQAKRPLLWRLLLMAEVFFLVSTKALVGLPMLAVLLLTLVIPQLNFSSLVGIVLVFAVLIALFVSTEFGRERLGSILETPLLNPSLTINRAILMSWYDANSFNWRLAQWNFLIEEWKRAPFWGYGLDLAAYLGPVRARAHNDYVRVLVEQGIIGSFLLLVFFVSQFTHLARLYFSSKNSSKRQFCLALIAILLAYLMGMTTENIWSHTTFFFYWWTLFCIAGWDWSKSQGGEDLPAFYSDELS